MSFPRLLNELARQSSETGSASGILGAGVVEFSSYVHRFVTRRAAGIVFETNDSLRYFIVDF